MHASRVVLTSKPSLRVIDVVDDVADADRGSSVLLFLSELRQRNPISTPRTGNVVLLQIRCGVTTASRCRPCARDPLFRPHPSRPRGTVRFPIRPYGPEPSRRRHSRPSHSARTPWPCLPRARVDRPRCRRRRSRLRCTGLPRRPRGCRSARRPCRSCLRRTGPGAPVHLAFFRARPIRGFFEVAVVSHGLAFPETNLCVCSGAIQV